ncbi:DUF5957 family protein [Amycolatopsis aidingensis]|uniref:DUF5957 family protein n=1 Tax=Amycolatopsis aidingensis TaxID=2842453 RepID=UPI001C0B303A|nr:DUF5957 family protein [Amycolatopsis aidingensis]
MRTLVVAILGVFTGLLAGFVLIEIIAAFVAAQSGGWMGRTWSLVAGFGPIIMAIAGAVVAIIIDNKIQRNKGM